MDEIKEVEDRIDLVIFSMKRKIRDIQEDIDYLERLTKKKKTLEIKK
jgi:hypothetical protein